MRCLLIFYPAQKVFLQGCTTIFIDRCTISVIETCEALGLTGTNQDALRDALAGYPMCNFVEGRDLPSTCENLEVIEFAHEKVAEPRLGDFRDFLGHHHPGFVRSEGRDGFREEINRIFDRNGIAFQLVETGQVQRIVPPKDCEKP
jgi:hypothetical protein